MLGPIFSVELVTAARRTRYFVVRVLYGLVLLAALWIVYAEHFNYGDPGDIRRVASFAGSFFVTFSVLQLLAVFFLAPAMAAGTIALERERRTIEYLFVSHLTNVEIVFGKLAARLVQIACLILVGLPVLALAGLMGGIAPEALLVVFLITLSTVLATAILSIAISVWSPKARDAVFRAYLVLFCVLVVPPVAEATMARAGWPLYDDLLGPVNGQLLAANPFWILDGVVWAASSRDAGAVWGIVGALVRNQSLVAALCLAAATLAVRRVHLSARSEGGKRRRFRLMQRLRPGCGDQPMLWKEVFAEPALTRLGIVGRIAALLIVLAVVGPTLWWFAEAVEGTSWRGRGEDYLMFTAVMGTLVGSGGLILAAARAATTVTAEKERDSWVSLLSTPLAPREIVLAKVAGSIYAVRGVFFLLAFLWFMALLIDPGFLVAEIFILATFLLLAFAVTSMGVVYSLWCRNSLRAMAATLATGLAVGGGYLFCCVPLMFASGPGDGGQVILAPCAPFLLFFPGVMYVEGESMMRHEAGMLAAYVLGVIGYGVAAVVLASSAVAGFDQFSGRSGTGVPLRPRPGPPQFVVPEVVEEPPP